MALQPNDIKFTHDEGAPAMSVRIREPKTDQEKAGITRTIRATGMLLRPVRAMRTLFTVRNISDVHEGPSFPANSRRKLVFVTKWGAREDGVHISVANTQPPSEKADLLRCCRRSGSGRNSTLGTLAAVAPHRYIWHVRSGFLELGAKIACSTGLNKFFVDVAPLRKRIRLEDDSSRDHSPRFVTGRTVVYPNFDSYAISTILGGKRLLHFWFRRIQRSFGSPSRGWEFADVNLDVSCRGREFRYGNYNGMRSGC